MCVRGTIGPVEHVQGAPRIEVQCPARGFAFVIKQLDGCAAVDMDFNVGTGLGRIRDLGE
jgi:hypothetical protein